jgi:hypothetical protein
MIPVTDVPTIKADKPLSNMQKLAFRRSRLLVMDEPLKRYDR